jgi:limonene-1,2-epoxide hydrolase
MTKIIIGEDCGNSPKNIFLQKFTIAFAQGDAKFILGSVTDDIRWNMVGEQLIQGKDNFTKALEQMKNDKAVELTIHHIATHGKSGAANGTTKLKNGKTRAYCDVYEFKDTKGSSVKEITSYMIEIK